MSHCPTAAGNDVLTLSSLAMYPLLVRRPVPRFTFGGSQFSGGLTSPAITFRTVVPLLRLMFVRLAQGSSRPSTSTQNFLANVRSSIITDSGLLSDASTAERCFAVKIDKLPSPTNTSLVMVSARVYHTPPPPSFRHNGHCADGAADKAPNGLRVVSCIRSSFLHHHEHIGKVEWQVFLKKFSSNRGATHNTLYRQARSILGAYER
ncbi:hypothetical protein F5146DRAFT_1122274 [Armillaria mellea]|nr:hypothetical protein F5146DRAFT_1122274 [Armillaria mellea]